MTAPPEQSGPAVVTTTPAEPTTAIDLGRWTPPAKGLLGGGIAALILGAGGVASGAALIGLDGRTSNDDVVGMDATRERTAHEVPGIVLTSVGAALLVGGSILVWRGKVDARPHAPLTRTAS